MCLIRHIIYAFIQLFWIVYPYIIVFYLCKFFTQTSMDSDSEYLSAQDSTDETKELNKSKKQRRKKSKQNLDQNLTENTKQFEDPTDGSEKSSLDDFFLCDIAEENCYKETKDIEINDKENTDVSEILNLNGGEESDNGLDKSFATNNGNLSKIFNLEYKMTKFYVVNEEVFLDSELTMISDEEYREYKLYKVMKTNDDDDVHRTEDDLSNDDLEESLLVTEELTKHGVIINNNVYLNYDQWNTIRKLTEVVYSCAVCQFQFDGSNIDAHIRMLSHVRKLDGHRPLKRFDLSIIRKINENFHCGVCNVLFPTKDYRDHENSKAHEGNLLFAINKVSDLMWSGENKTTQMLNTNNIQAPNNAPCAVQDGSWFDLIGNIGSNWQTELDGNPQRIIESNNSINIPDRNTEPGSNTESASNTEHAKNTDSFRNFSFENAYKDIRIYEEDFEEYTLPIEGVSYALMASKPRLDVPKYLKIDLGTKEVRVKYESWNMITATSINEYYCMVCTKTFHVRFKNQHCLEDEHKMSLAKCNVVGAFEDYLIRDISDTLYHCGHCNNLQYKSDIILHIEKYHPMKNTKRDPIKPLKLPIETNKLTECKLKSNFETKLDIFSDFKFNPFGAEITISNLSCHMIMIVDDRYKCALCDVFLQGKIIDHIYDSNHIYLINMTPFIRPFRCNLTRAVRGSLHCAICNILIPVQGINDHNIDPKHTNALASALGMVKNERPKEDVKYQNGGPGEFNTDLERFLSTLPPSTRGALSQLKIKNHKGEMFQLSDATSTSSSGSSTSLSMSVNNSPTHIRKDINKPGDTQGIKTYPQKGVDCINPTPNMGYPKPGVEGIKQRSEACYPIPGVDNINPAGYTQNSLNPDATGFYPKEAHIGPNACYPTGVQGINPTPPYLNRNNLPTQPFFKPGQIIPLSMIESGLPGVRTGSPISNVPLNLQITGPFELIMKSGVGRIPVSPVRRPEDIEVANELMSLYNQSPVRSVHQVTEPKVNAPEVNVPKVNAPAIAPKVEKNEGIDRNLDRMDFKQNIMAPDKPVSMENINAELRKKSITSESDDETTFKLDEAVLLKLKSSYFKVTISSYHTLVHLSNGTRHCFVCSSRLNYSTLRKHVDSRKHLENLSKNKILYNFCGQLFRQMFLTYHCTICNVTMSRKEVRLHLEWPTHIEKYDLARKKINKKFLRDHKAIKEFNLDTQKEFLYVNIPEPTINIVTFVQSSRVDFQETYVEKKLEKKCQMIILKENMIKISFEAWHGITKNAVKCIICQTELQDLMQHLETKYHNVALGRTFEKQYYPSLLRKINESIINCVICNLELSNDESVVFEHINGRKHEKNFATIIENTSRTDSYSDCYKYPITL